MRYFLEALTAGATLLLVFLVIANPRQVNRLANRWLASFLFCAFAIMVDDLLLRENIYHRYPQAYGITALVVFLLPPLLYQTILYYITPGRIFKKVDGLHFALFFIFLILLLPFIFSDAESKLEQIVLDQNDDTSDPASVITIILFLAQLGVYWVLSYLKLIRYQQNIRLYRSSEVNVDLKWLTYFLWSLLFMIMLWLPSILFNSNVFVIMADICFFIGVFMLAFFAVRQQEIFDFNVAATLEIKELIESDAVKNSVRKPDPEKVSQLKEQLTSLMATQKPYLQNDLTLPALATMLNTSTNILSFVINSGYDQNFFQFVNGHRIEEAKRLLADSKNNHLSMVGIGLDAGFSSKTVFNTTFKQSVGMTPSEYKKMHSPTSA